MIHAILFMLGLCLSGCVPALVSGRINTAQYSQAPMRPTFTVLSSRELTLTDRRIIEQIEERMVKLGYEKTGPSEANVVVLYRYSVGSGSSVVSSSPDVVFGGERVSSYAEYPHMFEVALVDLKRSKLPDKVELIWQAELRSSGSSSNPSMLTPIFLDELFERYGTTVTNQSFSTLVSR